MKPCRYCQANSPGDAIPCIHCGRNLRGDLGLSTYLLMTGVLMIFICGFAFWPFWVVALILAAGIKMQVVK